MFGIPQKSKIQAWIQLIQGRDPAFARIPSQEAKAMISKSDPMAPWEPMASSGNPLVNLQKTMGNHHVNWVISYKWPFSIAMLVYPSVPSGYLR